MSNNNNNIYFEKQSLKLCGLHTINNLLQYRAYTRSELEHIAYDLDQTKKWINPHKNFFGLGNYDANVLIVALNRKGFEVKWFDKRKRLDEIDFDKVYGIIVNCMLKKIMGLWNSRHWFGIKNMNYISTESKTTSETTTSSTQPPLTTTPFNYCLLNSETNPIVFQAKQNLINYLASFINENAEVLLVYEQSTLAEQEKQQQYDPFNFKSLKIIINGISNSKSNDCFIKSEIAK
ncbi:hypothetical protein PPL_05474 [Heterostelium album PN500]|uniref:ubiquitinyl hydrolase 1 n=1 Tax=Heterostelium pallidum (strain ATCC 26659 / Pp 5 / PN500) TaxID=670386 RepID=D3BA99_HETP5|nr:hypothetical protein PPL_05474 [Heterostelium album PN500]EFA81486.1 hypothetical protein PPL_05474 [Heterostelium album PN500]|eukprot:XP_020433604.1 hypothetical protein PPL_05474 [Heterostelium album PN500]